VASSGFGDLSKRIDLIAREMTGEAAAARLRKVGVLSKTDINDAVRADLGDLSMSGWRRGNPHEVVGRFDVVSPGTLEMFPAGKAKGPMRVLQQGRNQGDAAGFAGPGMTRTGGVVGRTKSGAVRKTRAFKARKWNGYTQGKDTWDDAVRIMERNMPSRYHVEWLRDVARHVKGG